MLHQNFSPLWIAKHRKNKFVNLIFSVVHTLPPFGDIVWHRAVGKKKKPPVLAHRGQRQIDKHGGQHHGGLSVLIVSDEEAFVNETG